MTPKLLSQLRSIALAAGLLAFAVSAATLYSSCDPCPDCSARHHATSTASGEITTTGTSTSTSHVTVTVTHTATPTSTATATTSTVPGSGLFVVDCTTNRAYVPLINSPEAQTNNGRVAVINLAVDPNSVDPRIATIVLPRAETPTGSAVDESTGRVFVEAGQHLYIISEASNTITNEFPLPTGSQAGIFGQVIFDPSRKKVIVAIQETSGCPTSGTCTGFTIFDPTSNSFGPIIKANYPETFAFNVTTNMVLDASDSNSSGFTFLVDLTGGAACRLNDTNIGGDQDGASVDATTNINVISNEDGSATVINLNGFTLTSPGTPSCVVNEGGTNPNSVKVAGLPGSTAGSAVNPVTHQAFLIEDGSPGITLMSLPSSPVTQITASQVSTVISSVPNSPDNSGWFTQGDPYAVAVAPCHNLGFAVDTNSNWLVQVDLAAFQNSPSTINTALPAGNCAGTTTTLGCKNNSGVTFFPLPPVP